MQDVLRENLYSPLLNVSLIFRVADIPTSGGYMEHPTTHSVIKFHKVIHPGVTRPFQLAWR